MIEVRSLRKSFDGFTALDGLDISVPDGAVYGLVGPNGAGKSTLIRHLAGILRQDAGEVLYDGEAVFENPAVKAQIAYIPDAVFYYPGASIKDMMLLYRRMYPSFSEERYNKLAPAFGIAPERSFKRLSKGMQKQAAFWLALSLCPKYMLLDEPLDGLDPVMRRQVMKLLLADVAERGTTVLVSSHNLRELEDVCDHVGIMNGGRMPSPAPAERASGQHRQGAARATGRQGAARRARDTAQERHRAAVSADSARDGGGSDERSGRGAAVFHRCAAADAGGDIYL